MTGVLSIGIVGGMGASAFATTTTNSDKGKQEKFEKIRDELKALGITFPIQEVSDLENLDEVTKEKFKEIGAQIKNKKLSSEDALEVRKQRINLSKQDEKAKIFADLDEDTSVKAMEIMDKLKAGAITRDVAITELKKLGVNLPNLGDSPDPFAHLDGETKANADEILRKLKEGTITKEEAGLEIRKLRIKLPEQENDK